MMLAATLDPSTLARLHALRRAARSSPDWKSAFDAVLAEIRTEFVYDNEALYLLDARRRNLEVAHARAAGRGRSREADINWGEELAGDVVAHSRTILRSPKGSDESDRLQRSFVIGLPVIVAGRTEGALVFVRFGGPEFSELHALLAEWLADMAGWLLESRGLVAARSELEQAQRQARLQDDFVSTISHELRTPLGFIKGYTTSLLREDTTWDAETTREFLTIIEEETDRLTQLIDNMLESARLQGQKATFALEPVHFDVLVNEAVTRIRTRKPDLEVRTHIQQVPAVNGDGPRLVQVLDNLFGNALKYAPGSPLTVRLDSDERAVDFSLQDEGPGIPEEYLPFLFDRFYRAHSGAGTTGTGLGLYICRQIVTAHHGKIWAQSTLDHGATFHIELPLSQP